MTTTNGACLTFSLLASAMIVRAALPQPGHQQDPWTPPAAPGIPEYVMSVAATLFDAGLADPRGGVYREIQLEGFSKGAGQTHGWVFAERYAVCWNGLVYRVQSVGAKADLERDVRLIAGTNPWTLPIWAGSDSRHADAAFWLTMELGAVRIVPASIALLLRLGEAGLAAQLWEAPEASQPFGVSGKRAGSEREWLNTLAGAWLGTAFGRLIDERSRGDDAAAVDTAESLLAWKSRFSTARNRMAGLEPTTHPNEPGNFSFLDPVAALLADSQRRSRQNPRSSLTGTHVSAFLKKPQAARIAELIDRLEDVAGRKFIIPGQLEYTSDPIWRLLEKEGEAAVEPLLDAYEHDGRLTRTVDYGRPWYIGRTPIPVSEVARTILNSILHFPDVVDSSSPAELRAWLARNKGKNSMDRLFNVLAADDGAAKEWLESADEMLRGSCDTHPRVPSAFGEPLRTRRGPSVSELMARRALQLAASKQEQESCRMAFLAYRWEPKTSLAALQAAGNLETCRSDTYVTAARIELGDVQAASQWAALVRQKGSKYAFETSGLAPLWMFPTNRVLEELAEWLFAGSESPLSPRVDFMRIQTPLLTVAAYRRAVSLALRDESVVGSASRSSDGSLGIRFENSVWSWSDGGGDPRQLQPGEHRPVRVKDIVAWELCRILGFPDFRPDWPAGDKDTAAANIEEFLRLHEKDLRAFPARVQDMACIREEVYLTP